MTSSLDQLVQACNPPGLTVVFTCTVVSAGTSYECDNDVNDTQETGMFITNSISVNPSTGAWHWVF